MSETERLARFIIETNYDALPGAAIVAAKRAILDCLGVMIAGSQEPAGQIISSFVKKLGGTPNSGVVASGFHTSAPSAALANGTMGHALDYDDVGSDSSGHPSVAILPAILALGEELHVPGRLALTAFTLAVDIWGKLPLSGMNPRGLGFHPTAIYGTLGAAVAAAKLLGLNIEEVQMVLGLAASHAAGMGRNRGTMTKPYHAGNAARSGVMAAMLVRDGFTATPGLLEGRFSFCEAFAGGAACDLGKVTAKLGEPYYVVSPGLGVKKYPSCYITHRAIDAILHLDEKHQINPGDVASITAETGSMATNILTYTEPVNKLQGKFSMQFCLAIALLECKVGLGQVTDEKVNDPKVRELMKKISLSPKPEPVADEDVVTVRLKDSTEFSCGVDRARGHAEIPLTNDELIAKYRECAIAALDKDKVERSLELILDLEKVQKINQLMDTIV